MLSFSRERSKLGCEGCWFNDKTHCPGENDNGKLLKQEDRICYNKEKDEESILTPSVDVSESIYTIEEEV